jgi:hypothetical protein
MAQQLHFFCRILNRQLSHLINHSPLLSAHSDTTPTTFLCLIGCGKTRVEGDRCAAIRFSTWLNPFSAAWVLALSILDSTMQTVGRSTSVPAAERFCAPLMRSPSQNPTYPF